MLDHGQQRIVDAQDIVDRVRLHGHIADEPSLNECGQDHGQATDAIALFLFLRLVCVRTRDRLIAACHRVESPVNLPDRAGLTVTAMM